MLDNNRISPPFDRINALIAAFVFLFTFIIYRLTLAPTFSFWDCGEFIACSYILGIPHPPGSPLFILLGRIFSVLPIASDICVRVNLISPLSQAAATLFAYLTIVRMISFWYRDGEMTAWKKAISYIGGVVGALFMAFGTTNWSNAVEAEVYGLSMLIMTAIMWLTLKYFDIRETPRAMKLIILVSYLAMLGVGVHLTTFLVIPVAAVFFILKKDAPVKAWIAICSFFVIELLLIIFLSDGRGGYSAFIAITVLLVAVLGVFVFRHINWAVLLAIGAYSMIMIAFYPFAIALGAGALVMVILGLLRVNTDWKAGLIILFIAAIGFSVHAFIPIRSSFNPRIDENMTSRDFNTFVNFLDRKQYGQMSMVERMFSRRAEWSSQFGRHAHMGFWSYFENQYGLNKIFGALFILGLFGIWFMIVKKLEIGLPFLVLLLLASVGLILYMNFADGIKYNARTGDAYQEVRDRDYFFIPAFILFGMAIGLGTAAVMESARTANVSAGLKKPMLYASTLLILLPAFPLARNYFTNDRSRHWYPYIYSYNVLSSCPPNAILFTAGDNDTFPLWCMQEVYEFRKDVRVVNLSLFNTDWYIYQMKHFYDVPIELTDEQILWYDMEFQGRTVQRPKEWFYDRARKRRTYLIPTPHDGRIVKLQDMMVDEVVLSNNFKVPICFTSEPYEESPLKLVDRQEAKGLIYELKREPKTRNIDADEGYRLFTEVYRWDGMDDPTIYRDENATGVLFSHGFNAVRIAQEFKVQGQNERAEEFIKFIIDKYPEFFQSYLLLANMYESRGEREKADSLFAGYEVFMEDLHRRNPENIFYLQDLGYTRHIMGKSDQGLADMWEALRMNPNNGHGYRKLMQVLLELQRPTEMYEATTMFANYKINRDDPVVRNILGAAGPATDMPRQPIP